MLEEIPVKVSYSNLVLGNHPTDAQNSELNKCWLFTLLGFGILSNRVSNIEAEWVPQFPTVFEHQTPSGLQAQDYGGWPVFPGSCETSSVWRHQV